MVISPSAGNLPVAVEYKVRRWRDGLIGNGPRVPLYRLGRHPDAKVTLTILPPVPRRDHAVAVLDRLMAVVAFGGARLVRQGESWPEDQTCQHDRA